MKYYLVWENKKKLCPQRKTSLVQTEQLVPMKSIYE